MKVGKGKIKNESKVDRIVETRKLPPLILSKRESVIRGPVVNKWPYWFMWECKKGVIKASPHAECYRLSSLYLTMVAELKDTMASKYFPSPALLKDKYSTWRKEMKICELETSLDKTKRALMVFLSLEGTAREAVLELDTAVPNSEDGTKKLYEKLDTLFLEDINQSAFRAYETFKNFRGPPGVSLEDFLLEFGRLIAKLKDFNILLPEPVLAFRALKSTNITPDNEKLVKASVSELTLSSMLEQLRKIMHGHSSSDSSPNTLPVVVKNEMDIVNYTENNQMDPTEVYFCRFSYRHDSHFNNSREKINGSGRRQGYKNKTHSTNKKKINPRDQTGNITVCFNCGSRFHWSYDFPYVHSTRNKDGVKIEEDFSVSHMAFIGKQKRKNGRDIFLDETLGSAVLDSGASSTICGTKWYKFFLETLTDAQKKKIVKNKGVRTFKFGDGNKLNSLYKVILPCVIAYIKVSIITDVVDSDIPLLLSKDAIKRTGTCLNFEDDTVTMLKKKIPLCCIASGHYYIPITKPLPDKRKFKHIPFIKEISSKNTTEKIKMATKLYRQFSHPSSKKLCDFAKNAGLTDPAFIKTLQTLPNSCELCIRYEKTEPKPIVGNFNMASVTSGSNSGISKRSLYKPAPKEKIKAKHTNRKPLAQSQIVDLNNPRSAKICKNGMKSLLTLERNFLSPDVQRRETICIPGKASISCRQYDAEVDDKLSETMNEKENWNKEDSVVKVICHVQRSAKKKLLWKSRGSTCKKTPHVFVSATEIKSNSSFFNKDANTTLLNNMNATQLHFDSSDSEKDLNSRRKKKIDPNKSYNVTMNRDFAWRWLFWERCLKEKKLQRSLGYQLTHKLPTPWQRKECLHLRSWGLYLNRKSPLFNVVTLSYFLLQNLCPTEIKRKRGKTCKDMQVTSPDTLEKRERYSRTGCKQTAILVYVRV